MHREGLRVAPWTASLRPGMDPWRRARLLRYLWLISTGFTVFGFAVMLYLIWASR